MLVNVWKDKKDDAGRMSRLVDVGVDVDKTYTEEELAKGNELVFAASGVTKGELLDGVRFTATGATVSSLCVRLPSGTFEKSESVLRFKDHPVYRTIDLCGHPVRGQNDF
jgi:fructose-1,6-bisphosphatase II